MKHPITKRTGERCIMKPVDEKSIDECLVKWQPLLSLSDWDIRSIVVQKTNWRKSGDVKIDESNRMAAVMIKSDLDPVYLEQVVVHELLHIKLWGLDQMIEESLRELEATTQDLTRALLDASGFKGDYLFNRVQKQIDGEIEKD
jgi:hypothetical protein